MALGTDPEKPDTDQDGLSDFDEAELDTDPLNPDTDGDVLTDGEEVEYKTNPLSSDTDDDGLTDGMEILKETDPNNPDSDGDGIPDKEDQDPPLPEWAEEMSNKNDWTPQPDSNGMGGLEGFYPLAMLAAVKFTVTCDTCDDPTSNPQYWRTVAKTIYDNGYNPDTNTYCLLYTSPSPRD